MSRRRPSPWKKKCPTGGRRCCAIPSRIPSSGRRGSGRDWERINAYHRLEAMRLQLYARKNLYHDAVRAYLQAVENGYPVMVYEVIAEFTVTYNQNCALSLYTDQYIFTGGATAAPRGTPTPGI